MEDMLENGREKTVVSYCGDLVKGTRHDRDSYQERDRIRILANAAKALPMARVVRIDDCRLGLCIDFNHLYKGSDELQDAEVDDLSVLKGVYASFPNPPVSFEKEDIEQWVGQQFSKLVENWKDAPGIYMGQVTNSSFVEFRIYIHESVVFLDDMMRLLAAEMNTL